MKLIRNYLTSKEMMELINTLIDEENAVTREVLKVGVVCQLLTDAKEMDTCNDYYDEYMNSDLCFEKDIKNYGDIDYLLEQEIGVRKVVVDFIKAFGEKIDSMSDINMEQTLESLKGLIDNGKTV